MTVMNTVVQENVRGIRVVKAYVREDHETEKFENVSEHAVPHVLQGAEDHRSAICRSCSSACMRACCSSRGSARV